MAATATPKRALWLWAFIKHTPSRVSVFSTHTRSFQGLGFPHHPLLCWVFAPPSTILRSEFAKPGTPVRDFGSRAFPRHLGFDF